MKFDNNSSTKKLYKNPEEVSSVKVAFSSHVIREEEWMHLLDDLYSSENEEVL